jgi:hypothetical protein
VKSAVSSSSEPEDDGVSSSSSISEDDFSRFADIVWRMLAQDLFVRWILLKSRRTVYFKHTATSFEKMAEVVEKNLWAHSCCTHEELKKAIADEDIKFIESDIIISSSTGKWLIF